MIDYDARANAAFYAYLERLGRLVAREVGALWLPDLPYRLTGLAEVPHNLGGVPMGASPVDGVVDHAGRVFGYENLVVLDGSIVPLSIGPNPALTIAALAERGMDVVLEQLARTGATAAEAS